MREKARRAPDAFANGSVGFGARPDPFADLHRCLREVGVLAETLGVMAVLVVLVAVPVDEPKYRLNVASADRDPSPEGVVDAALINGGVVQPEPVASGANVAVI